MKDSITVGKLRFEGVPAFRNIERALHLNFGDIKIKQKELEHYAKYENNIKDEERGMIHENPLVSTVIASIIECKYFL